MGREGLGVYGWDGNGEGRIGCVWVGKEWGRKDRVYVGGKRMGREGLGV